MTEVPSSRTEPSCSVPIAESRDGSREFAGGVRWRMNERPRSPHVVLLAEKFKGQGIAGIYPMAIQNGGISLE